MVRELGRDGKRLGDDTRVKNTAFQAESFKQLAVKHYTGISKEALLNHPPQWNSRKSVAGPVLDRSTADIYTQAM